MPPTRQAGKPDISAGKLKAGLTAKSLQGRLALILCCRDSGMLDDLFVVKHHSL
jgi:hypothetical protein